jgi:hypothetical protein
VPASAAIFFAKPSSAAPTSPLAASRSFDAWSAQDPAVDAAARASAAPKYSALVSE